MSVLNCRRVQEGFVIVDQESMDKVNAAIAAGSEGLVDENESKKSHGAADEAGPTAGHDEAIENEKEDAETENYRSASKRRKVYRGL